MSDSTALTLAGLFMLAAGVVLTVWALATGYTLFVPAGIALAAGGAPFWWLLTFDFLVKRAKRL